MNDLSLIFLSFIVFIYDSTKVKKYQLFIINELINNDQINLLFIVFNNKLIILIMNYYAYSNKNIY
jgi:hypothetical protein